MQLRAKKRRELCRAIGARVGQGIAISFEEVVGESEEVITGLTIESADLLRWQMSVASGRMRMQVAAPEAARRGEREDVHRHSFQIRISIRQKKRRRL